MKTRLNIPLLVISTLGLTIMGVTVGVLYPVTTLSPQEAASQWSAYDDQRIPSSTPLQSAVETIDVMTLPAPPPEQLSNSKTLPRTISQAPTVSAAAILGSTGPSVVSVISSFNGLTQIDGAGLPPDVQVAPGLNHIVEMVNIVGRIYDKQGNIITTFTLPSFWGTGRNAIGDPKVLYDIQSHRWFASVYDFTAHSVPIAISATDNPINWVRAPTLLTVTNPNCFPDQPILGVSDDKLVVSANVFDCSGNNFAGAQHWVVNKSDFINAANNPQQQIQIHFQSFGPNANQVSVHPVHSLSSTTTQYMVSTGCCATTSSVTLFSITGVPPNVPTPPATVLTLNSPINTLPDGSLPDAVQRGTTELVETNDARVQSAAYREGSVWVTTNSACTPTGDQQRSCFHMIQIDTTSSPITVRQDFDVGASGQYYFYPTVTIDGTGNVAVMYGFSSSNDFPSLAVRGQGATDPINSISPSRLLVAGSAPDTTGAVRSDYRRYGDYFGAGVDPADTTLVWVAGEYHNTNTGGCSIGTTSTGNCWSTFIGSIRLRGFTIAPSGPTTVTCDATATCTSSVTVTGLNGLTDTVTFVVSPSTPAGLNCSPMASVTLSSSPSASALTCSAPTAGDYAVTVTGTSTTTSTVTHTTGPINFHVTLLVSFGFNPQSPVAGQTVTFTGSAAGGTPPYDFQWQACCNFSPTTMSGNPVNYVFPYSANYFITLSVTDSNGKSKTVFNTISVRTSADFTYSPAIPHSGDTLTFTATASFGVRPYAYNWDFGDLATGTGSPSTHIYSVHGSYIVTLTVRDANQVTETVQKTVSVLPPLVADFTASPSVPTMGQTATFSATISGGVGPYVTQWDFGDGGSSQENPTNHVYYSAGAFTVTLYVTDATGTTKIVSKSVNVAGFDIFFTGPSPLWIAQGSSRPASLTLRSLHDFTGWIDLYADGVPAGTSCALNPSRAFLNPNQQVSITCTITVGSNVTPQIYTLTVRAQLGSLTDTTTVTFRVVPSSILIDQTLTFNGVRTTLSGNLTVNTETSGLMGTIYVSATDTTSGNSVVSNRPVTISITYNSNGRALFLVEVDTSPYRLSANCEVTVTTGSATCVLTRTLDISHNGTVDIFDASTMSLAYDSVPGDSNWDPRADFDASSRVDIVDAATLGFYYDAVVFRAYDAS